VFVDRTTAIGAVIGDYLSKRCELDDHAVHLLFSANRWENMWVYIATILSYPRSCSIKMAN